MEHMWAITSDIEHNAWNFSIIPLFLFSMSGGFLEIIKRCVRLDDQQLFQSGLGFF